MKSAKWYPRLLLVLTGYLFFYLTGCAPVISKEIRDRVSEELTLSEVAKNPEAYKGTTVLWSGLIISAINLQEGTMIEVLQKPADVRGKPKDVDYSEGRFLVIDPRYLDVAIYTQGRMVTVAGEVQGKKIQDLGEMKYTYPLVSAKEIYLWPEEREERYYYPYPYWDYPWWHYPYPHPGW
ncbi:MAG: Slp/YeaY family lipoprotein [Deltaproteobacteria bacterium]|nr:Slp/YeaY family lipoprotein [Deltaproteobacteria bacterium]